MSPNHSSKSSMNSGDSPLERITTGGTSSSQSSNSSRSAFGRMFGSRPTNRLRKGSVDLRGAEALSVRPSYITASGAGTDTPRPSTATDPTADSAPGQNADMLAKDVAARLVIGQATSRSEGSQAQSQSQSQFGTQTQAQTQTQPQTQPQSQSSTKTSSPARYGSQGYTEDDIATFGANYRPGIRASDATNAIAAFRKQASEYRKPQE